MWKCLIAHICYVSSNVLLFSSNAFSNFHYLIHTRDIELADNFPHHVMWKCLLANSCCISSSVFVRVVVYPKDTPALYIISFPHHVMWESHYPHFNSLTGGLEDCDKRLYGFVVERGNDKRSIRFHC